MKLSNIKFSGQNRRKTVVFAISTIIVATCAFLASYIAYRKCYVEPFVHSFPEHVRPFVEYEPYPKTLYALIPVATLTMLGAFWLGYLSKKLQKRLTTKGVATLTAIAILVVAIAISARLNVNAAWNGTINKVDVLAMADEEFAAHSDWIQKAEQTLAEVSSQRFADSGIAFYIRGWLMWNSTNGETDSYLLMQQALAESGLPRQKVEVVPGFQDWGFISGSEWTGAYGYVWKIDLLLIFTGQDIDYFGLSPPMLNMTIIRYDHVDLHTLTHELGHQYYLSHCSNPWCVMNADWQFGDNFCSDCRAKLNANRDKWVTDPLDLDVNGDGRVNIGDLVAIAKLYDCTPDSPQWNPKADLNRDGVIDVGDLATLAANISP